MGIEIERKFLVDGEAWRAVVRRATRLVQGYLVGGVHGEGKSSVRVRIGDGRGWLNIKSSTLGIARDEYEYEIPLADAERMLATLCGGTIEKIRHEVAIGEHVFEIDEFLGANVGLIVAEIELDATGETFQQPAWLGCEVSHLPRYYNLHLIDRPYVTWTAMEKEER